MVTQIQSGKSHNAILPDTSFGLRPAQRQGFLLGIARLVCDDIAPEGLTANDFGRRVAVTVSQIVKQEHLTLGLICLEPTSRWSPDGDDLVFAFVREGFGNYVAGEAIQPLAMGDVLVTKAGRRGSFSSSTDEGIVFCSFSLRLESLYPLFTVEEVSLLDAVAGAWKKFRLFPARGQPAKECHRLIAQISDQGTLDDRCQLLRVATVLLGEEFKSARSSRVAYVHPEERFRKLLENLSSHELLTLSIDELAQEFGCGRRHLNRLFHQHFGASVTALRMEMRMLKARTLLRNPNAKVGNVAEECGFHHLGLFNACFTKRFGTTPGRWREEARLSAGDSSPPKPAAHFAQSVPTKIPRPSLASEPR